MCIMTKESTHLSLDSELKRKAKNEGVNLSDLMNQTLKQVVEKSDSKQDQLEELKKEKNQKEKELIETESKVSDLKDEIQTLDSQIGRLKVEIEAQEQTTDEEERFIDLIKRHTSEGNWKRPDDIPVFWVNEIDDVSSKQDLWSLAVDEGVVSERFVKNSQEAI